jgi:hypothetical protein
MAARAAVEGNVRIEIDGTFGPVNWLAAGLQDMTGVELFSAQNTLQGFSLNINDGVKWTFDTMYVNGVIINSNSSSPVFTSSAPLTFFFVYLEGSIASTTTSPFAEVVSGQFNAQFTSESFAGDNTHPFVKVDVGATCFIDSFENSGLATNAVDQTSVGLTTITFDASSAPQSQGVAPVLLDPVDELFETFGPLPANVGTSGTTPAVAGLQAGVAPTVVGNDTAGSIEAVLSLAAAAAGLVHVTFATAFGSAPKAVMLTPGNGPAVGLFAFPSSVTPTGFDIDITTSAVAGTYDWFYTVLG